MWDWLLPTEFTITRSWITLGISALLISGFLLLAVKWFIQRRLTEKSKARVTAMRLLGILLAGDVMGVTFYAVEMARTAWTVYDILLGALTLYTWYHALKARGSELFQEKLSLIQELSDDVEERDRRLQTKDIECRRKIKLFRSFSHDLRAPLNGISLNAELIKRAAPIVTDNAQLIQESVQVASSFVTKMMEFAMTDVDDTNRVCNVSIEQLIMTVAKRFAPLAHAKGMYLCTNTDDVQVFTDPTKLERVLSNLVDNAIKYSDSGGINIRGTAVDGGIEISVQDTGQGIAQEHVDQLFDEYYRAGSQNDRGNRGGFGMGLSICRSLSRQLGGDVRLSYTSPEGSCFKLFCKNMDPVAVPVE
jgi:signal transduction histidine kinase